MEVAQSVERGIVVPMMKIVGGSNPTVSSLVDPVSELKSFLRGEVPGGCLRVRLLRSDRPNTAAHGTAPHAYKYLGPIMGKQLEVDPRGTSSEKTLTMTK
jgi:hypothetical protein